MDVAGSDKSYGFCYKGKGKELFVFEAPIDMLSHIALYPTGWKEHSVIRQIKRCLFCQIKTGLSEHLTMV